MNFSRSRPQSTLGKPSQLCGRFSFPADDQASPFGSVFLVDTAPHFCLFVGGSVDPAAGVPIYALLFDANDQALIGPPRRAKFSIGPILPGGSFVFSEPVTEWWGLSGVDGGQLVGRQPMAGMPIDNGMIVAASTTPLTILAPLGDFLSIFYRGQR